MSLKYVGFKYMGFKCMGFKMRCCWIVMAAVALTSCGGGGGSANAAPTASFRITTSSYKAPATLAFNGSASSDSDGSVASHSWDFGDGVTANGAVVSHQYSTPGSFTVALTVTDNKGAQASTTQVVGILANQPAEPSFEVNGGSFWVPANVQFDASASVDPDGSIAAYGWNFGDGSSGQGPVVSHVFANVGNYAVVLTLTDSDGELSTAQQLVQVIARPAAGDFSVSGTVLASAETAVDTDTNDPFSLEVSNNRLADAQPLTSPVNVSGFVAAGTGTGNTLLGDRFATRPDVSDFYQVNLTQGQQIYLEIADWVNLAVDLDLYLYDELGNVVEFSVGATDAEVIIAPAEGAYYLEVLAYAGYSSYQLSVAINNSQAGSPAGAMSSRAPVIPDQLIVEYRDSLVLGRSGIALRGAKLGLAPRDPVPGRPLLNHLMPRQSVLNDPVDAHLNHFQPSPYVMRSSAEWAELRAKYQTLVRLKQLLREPQVKQVSANYRLTPQLIPNDPLYIQQWHYSRINVPQAWNVSSGSGAIVAVLDTGVYLAHEDLSSNLIAGYDFISDAARALDGDGIDANPDDPGDSGLSGNSSWHGTHVAGTVAALTNNAKGGAGVAYGAKVMPLRVLGSDGGSSYDIQQALRYAAGLANDSGTVPVRRADIVNLSLGCQFCYSTSDASVYQQVRAAGVILIAAAGNDGSAAPGYPASYPGVVSVSATDRFDVLAPYSNYGSSIDIAAPGGYQQSGAVNGILSTLVDQSTGARRSGYAFYQGTSMAAPHVAGVAALMVGIYPALTPAEFDTAISSGAMVEDLGPIGRDDQYGYGRIDALKAVQYATALAGGTAAASLVLSPSVVDLGLASASAEVSLSKVGDQSPQIVSITSSANWLTISAQAIDADGLGRYTVTVDRSGLSDGVYQGTILFTPDIGAPIELRVGVINNSASSIAGAGHLWILLLDENFNVFQQVDLNPDMTGAYPYLFSALPAGNYYLIAGTDTDNDLELCDAGEVCGAYPTLGLITPLRVDGDITQADFLVLMGSALSSSASMQPTTQKAPFIRRH